MSILQNPKIAYLKTVKDMTDMISNIPPCCLDRAIQTKAITERVRKTPASK